MTRVKKRLYGWEHGWPMMKKDSKFLKNLQRERFDGEGTGNKGDNASRKKIKREGTT